MDQELRMRGKKCQKRKISFSVSFQAATTPSWTSWKLLKKAGGVDSFRPAAREESAPLSLAVNPTHSCWAAQKSPAGFMILYAPAPVKNHWCTRSRLNSESSFTLFLLHSIGPEQNTDGETGNKTETSWFLFIAVKDKRWTVMILPVCICGHYNYLSHWIFKKLEINHWLNICGF